MTSLDLSENDFDWSSCDDLVTFLAALPAGVQSLNLSENLLGGSSTLDLKKIFASIPASVTSLNLSRNQFNTKTGAELESIFACLKHITSLTLALDEVTAMTPEQRIGIRSKFPLAEHQSGLFLERKMKKLPNTLRIPALSRLGFPSSLQVWCSLSLFRAGIKLSEGEVPNCVLSDIRAFEQ